MRHCERFVWIAAVCVSRLALQREFFFFLKNWVFSFSNIVITNISGFCTFENNFCSSISLRNRKPFCIFKSSLYEACFPSRAAISIFQRVSCVASRTVRKNIPAFVCRCLEDSPQIRTRSLQLWRADCCWQTALSLLKWRASWKPSFVRVKFHIWASEFRTS